MIHNDLRSRRRLPRIPMTGMNLKLYGCFTMLFYSFSMSVIQNGMLQMGQGADAQLQEILAADPDMVILSAWAAVFQLLGWLAVPVFAFLLVEGFLHTENYRAYLLRMLIFAAVSELPFDFAMSGRWFDWNSQNLLFTLTICLVMLYGLKLFSANRMMQVLIVIAAVLWSGLMRASFGLCIVLLTAVYYLLRDKPKAKLVLGSLISLLYITGPVSAFALARYDGQRGAHWNKYVFYILYPAHLLLLGLVANFLV